MKKIVFISLMVLAINAVLIQTIVDENSMLKNLIRVGILAIVVMSLLIKKQPISRILFFLIIVSVIGLVLGQNTDQLSYVFTFIFVHTLFMVKTKEVEKYLMLSSIIALVLVFAFLILGITQNTVLDLRNRMTFGTTGVPFFFNLVYGAFTMLIIFALKYFKRFKYLTVLFSIGVTTYLFLLTDVRGGYISFIAFIVLLVIIPIISKVGIFRNIVALIPVFAIGAAIYIASLGNDYSANEFLSNRPHLWKTFLDNLSFFDFLTSRSVKAYDSFSVVDNSYIHLLAGGGLIISLAVVYLFYKAILNMFKHKRHVEIAFIIATCMYFSSESIMVRIENMFVIYFWYLVIKYSLAKVEVQTEDIVVKTPKRRWFKKYKIVW